MTDAKKATIVAVIGATASITVAVIGALAIYFATKRDRRRGIYGEAVKAIVGWREYVYRIRRRQDEQAPDLIARMHELQDTLSFYQAWIGSESAAMNRSYDFLVWQVKNKTQPLIDQAWADNIRPIPGNAREGEDHPNISPAVDRFLQDVRSHLSPNPIRKIAVWTRNTEKKDTKRRASK